MSLSLRLLLVFLLCTCSDLFAQKREWLKQQRVKSISIYEFDYENGVQEANGHKTWVFIYDRDGNLAEKTGYSDGGRLLLRWVFTYDAEGKRLTSINYSHSSPEKTIYRYNSHGHVIESAEVYPDGTTEPLKTYEYRYEKGRVVERNEHTSRGNIRYIFSYDNSGKLIESITESSSGRTREIYSYNEYGHVKETVTYNGNNPPLRQIHLYDANRYLTEESIYYPDGRLESKKTYQFDNRGFQLETTEWQGNKPSKTMRYKFEFHP